MIPLGDKKSVKPPPLDKFQTRPCAYSDTDYGPWEDMDPPQIE